MSNRIGTTTNTTQDQTTSNTGFQPAVDNLQNSFFPNVEAYNSSFGNGAGLYGGSVLAGQDQNLTDAQNSQLNLSGRIDGQLRGVNNTLQGFLNPDPNSAQNTLQRNLLGQRITQQFTQGIQPGIEDLGTSSGQFGGNQQNIALGAASQGLANAVGQSELGLMNADQDRAFQAMIASPGLIQSQLLPSQIQGDVGLQRSGRNQQELLDQIQQFESPRRNEFQGLLEQQGLVLPTLGAQNSSTGSGSTYQDLVGYGKGNTGTSAVGGAISGALGGAATGFTASGGNPIGAAVGGVAGAIGSFL
jgi:hypothetical protein